MRHTARSSVVIASYWHVGTDLYVSNLTAGAITVEDLLPCVTRGPKSLFQQPTASLFKQAGVFRAQLTPASPSSLSVLSAFNFFFLSLPSRAREGRDHDLVKDHPYCHPRHRWVHIYMHIARWHGCRWWTQYHLAAAHMHAPYIAFGRWHRPVPPPVMWRCQPSFFLSFISSATVFLGYLRGI
jgi:hypothetical protein